MIRRALYQIAGIDRETLATCPATDKMWAAHLGLSLLLSFTVVLGITFHATGYVITNLWLRLVSATVVALTVFMFALMLVAYAQNLIGGGDLKILTFAFLWVGIQCGLPFAVLLFVFRSLHTIAAKLGWVGAQRLEGRTRIAFAPAVAGALIGTFPLGCLHPISAP